MKHSETPRGQGWLRQFELDDQLSAARMLDSVHFVQGGTMLNGVRRQAEEVLEAQACVGQIAMAPVLSEEDMAHLGGGPSDEKKVAFRNFYPDQKIGSDPGSEALIAHLIREIGRVPGHTGLLSGADLTLAQLAAARTRTLVCLTDFIGSGKQVLRYVEAWQRNETIRSWRSLGWLRIIVVAYAATMSGYRAVQRCKYIDELKVDRIVPTISEEFSKDEVVEIVNICNIYAKREGRDREAMGFKGSAALFASSYSVPNNLPWVMIGSGRSWEPFFYGRSVTAELAVQLGESRPSVDFSTALGGARRNRLRSRFADDEVRSKWQPFLAMLSIMPRSNERIAAKLDCSIPEVERMRRSLEGLGLATPDGAISARGREALRSHGQKKRHMTASLAPSTSPYYPWRGR